MLPNVHIVTIDEDSLKCKNLSEFLDSEGIPFKVFRGVNAKKLGLISINQYRFSTSTADFVIKQQNVGCYLSHHCLWKIFLMSNEFDRFGMDAQWTILEDDCVFRQDWRENLNLASHYLPKNWDVLLIGSCCSDDKYKISLGANLYECKYPFCTHGYIVRGRSLKLIVDLCEDMNSPVDIKLATEIFPKLNVYTILPRICDQDGIDLPA